jgi:hypothetical protein
MPEAHFSDKEAAQAVAAVLGDSRWVGVTLAKGYLSVENGEDSDQVARTMFESGPLTLKKAKELLCQAAKEGFLATLSKREKMGSAENPITKLFPATITEQRFAEVLDALCTDRKSIAYVDDRASGHTLSDFTLSESDWRLPINIKNAGTRFEKAQDLVKLDPEDCIPIPAYKAHGAVEALPNLLYVVCPDYSLIGELNRELPRLFTKDESIVWRLLNSYAGTLIRHAEDKFVFAMVKKHWNKLRTISSKGYYAISARKAIRILQTKPERTPGIGLRAWGTGASAEVNVHVSIRDDMTPWQTVADRIIGKGIKDIVDAVNRKRVENVHDPEI